VAVISSRSGYQKNDGLRCGGGGGSDSSGGSVSGGCVQLGPFRGALRAFCCQLLAECFEFVPVRLQLRVGVGEPRLLGGQSGAQVLQENVLPFQFGAGIGQLLEFPAIGFQIGWQVVRVRRLVSTW